MQNGAIRGLATCVALGVLIVATAASARLGGGYRGHVTVGGYHGGVVGGYRGGVVGGYHGGVVSGYHGGVVGGYHGGVVGGYHGGVVGGYSGGIGIGHYAFAHGLVGYGNVGFRRYAFRRGWWWGGPVFLPFLFGDVLAFTLWPYEYYNPFWTLGANFALASILAPEAYFAPGYGPYWYGALPNIYYSAEGAERAQANAAAMQGCSGLAPDVSALPAQRIRQVVNPTAEQETILDDLISASSKARAIVEASCPKEVPLIPLGRLDAAEKRLEAMIQAVDIVHSPLEKFYDSLRDEQKQRFEAISSRAEAGGNLAMLCGPQSESLTSLPEQRIEQAIQPNAQQHGAFDELKKASEDATKDLQASCPALMPQTPVARLDAVKTRLSAMVEALKTVRPKLEDFYASLNDEQKARFNILSPPLQASPQSER